ncbi:unnamed protein product [Paramecium pentaurelia]|uniref:Uncharacterized protein n=1 Tax=Paramecium pentaurelia TaxID=43138 RepID=A0A8S1VHV3_9CILI|nr:unnamed protein product [Paramecium pentaurelia]
MKGTQETWNKLFAYKSGSSDNLHLINVITVHQQLKMIHVKLKHANWLQTKQMVHADHFQKVVSIMEMEDVLIQKLVIQLVQVIQVFQNFVKLLFLEIYFSCMQCEIMYRQYYSHKE